MYTRNGDDAKQKHYLLSGLMFGLIAGSFFASNAMTFVFFNDTNMKDSKLWGAKAIREGKYKDEAFEKFKYL
ncbi:hypothetical protein M7I_4827 [Glarea lozoyensis 74030]|uniref:Uncharacterized protein n=1 Tax=Glarea lozoyensis (strain ATCC 74030 / MF5533) TaxID=1104152 RepID=H0EQ81_GLAL7|nr:hypothetical protein M7I_4827 [Glarea lozoyensis 74030]